jgi:hypothetical protein
MLLAALAFIVVCLVDLKAFGAFPWTNAEAYLAGPCFLVVFWTGLIGGSVWAAILFRARRSR